MTKKRTPYDTRFVPQHFPVGTVCQLSSELSYMRDEAGNPRVITVQGIVRNGLDSYVLKTGVKKMHSEYNPEGIDEGINISHVDRILKRGDGPVKIDYGYYTSARQDKRMLEDIRMMELTKPFPDRNWSPKKGCYNTGSLTTVLHYEVSKVASEGQMIDHEKMHRAVYKQPWCTFVKHHFFHAYSINKKQLRKFLKANLNRWLLNMKKALKAEREEQQQDYERMWDEEDRNLSLPSEFVTNFQIDRLEVYRAAAAEVNEPEIEVRDTDCDGRSQMGSLWFYGNRGNGPLDKFWAAFHKLETKAKFGTAQEVGGA